MSNIERRISPAVPAMAKTMESAESDLSTMPVFLAKRPVCRKYRSAAKDKSRKIVVTQQPAMKRGFNPSAPMSEM